jgi:hypothetical protein
VGETQYVVTGALVIAAVAVLIVRRRRVWHRSPVRFWVLPLVAAIGVLAAVPAGEVDTPAGAGLLVLGGAAGLVLGGIRSRARFTEVGVDEDGSIAYRPNALGLVVLLVVFAAHYLADLLAEEATGLQFLLTVLLTLGVGETIGWHTGVFLRWRAASRHPVRQDPAPG